MGHGPSSSSVLEDRPRKLQRRTLDDVASLAGAAIGALALVWVLFERVFAFSGLLGFVVCWYVTFVVLYAWVTGVSNPRTAVVDRVASAAAHGGAAIVGLTLATTVGFIFVKAWPALSHLNFFTKDMAGVRPTSPLTQGGIVHAMAGSAVEVGIAVAIALPLGLATAVYMTEVGGRLATTVRTVVEAMTALPQIEIDRIDWEIGSKAPAGRGAPGAQPAPTASGEAEGAESQIQTAEISGKLIVPQASDFRAVTALVNQFTEMLRRRPGTEVTRTQLPFDINAEKSLSGDIGAARAEEVPTFSVLVSKRRGT